MQQNIPLPQTEDTSSEHEERMDTQHYISPGLQKVFNCCSVCTQAGHCVQLLVFGYVNSRYSNLIKSCLGKPCDVLGKIA